MSAPHQVQCHRSDSGFSMVELLIVMVMFIVVILISSKAFNSILTSSVQQVKSSESNIQGVVGLEMMRSDLERAGYGLPWCQTFTANWSESGSSANPLAIGINPASFNDSNNSTKSNVYIQLGDGTSCLQGPRALQSGTATGANAWENGRDYLVIKAASVGMNGASKKWSYLGSSGGIKTWGTTEDFVAGDRIISIDAANHRLIGTSMTNTDFSYTFTSAASPGAGFIPGSIDENYVLYGIDSNPNPISFPYNRVDYYIGRPAVRANGTNDMPDRCAKGTGILYKSNLVHSSGVGATYPLLECVADMQVTYLFDTLNDGNLSYINENITAYSAEEIRKQLKEIKVYILAHEGQKDKTFTYPTSSIQVGDTAAGGRLYDLTQLDSIGDEWKYYRWKVYTMVVKPNNLNN